MIKPNQRKLILQGSMLVGFGLSLIILSAIFSGRFPYFGYSRIIYLAVSSIVAISFIASFIVYLIRNTFGRETVLSLMLTGTVLLLSVVEYYHLVRKQDELIAHTIYSMESNLESYEILSDFPRNEAITILRDRRIPKKLCGVSYFFGVFSLCVFQEHRTIDFMVDITHPPGVKRTIRASESFRRNQ